MDENLRRLAMAIDGGDPATSCHMTKGIVMSVSLSVNPPTVGIQLSGDTTTTIEGVRFLDSYSPVVGDVVQIIKQSSMLLIIGQIAVPNLSPAGQGWVEPVLSANWATDAFDTVRYRAVVDNGMIKIQLRGKINRTSGTPTTFWTMPAGLRPPVNLAPVIISRGWGGGAVSAQMQINANGTLVLEGYTAAPAGGNTGSSSPGTSTHGGHQHWLSDWLGGPPKDFTPDPGNGSHSHTVNSHTHTFQSTVSHPDWVGFNGVEWFI